MRMGRSAGAVATEAAAFSFMVGIVAAVAMLVLGNAGLVTACGLAIALATVVYIVVMILNRGGTMPPPRGPGNIEKTNTLKEVKRDRPAQTAIRGPVVDKAGNPVTGSRAPATAAGGAGQQRQAAAPAATEEKQDGAKDDDPDPSPGHHVGGENPPNGAASSHDAASDHRHTASAASGGDASDDGAAAAKLNGAVKDESEAPEGQKPETLASARDGQPDDLKKIRGVGPKIEEMLNGLGFYHFDQIAGWNQAESAWVDARLEGFRGRVDRDDWVSQAKTLSQGGSTDFAERVQQGDVY